MLRTRLLSSSRKWVSARCGHQRNVLTSTRLCHDSKPERTNEVDIQMLPTELHRQVFNVQSKPVDAETLGKIEDHLKQHGIWGQPTSHRKDVTFNLPQLRGENLNEHFKNIAGDISKPYLQLVETLLKMDRFDFPEKWVKQIGWTFYDPETGKAESVPYPDSDAMVFDVEVLVPEGKYPVMAAAVTPRGWYTWCSARLVDEDVHTKNEELGLKHLINLEPDDFYAKKDRRPRLAVGHNVSFDRTFVREQYHVQHTDTKFLDTMALHIATAGLTQMQRQLYLGSQKADGGMGQKKIREYTEKRRFVGYKQSNLKWKDESSTNSLLAVHELYCEEEPRLEKQARDVFVSGTMEEVREKFQQLMTYNATDVRATLSVFRELWPQFRERMPHEVTIAGMLEMSVTYLPINQNWERYVQRAEHKHIELKREIRDNLMDLAEKALAMPEEEYKNDLWLWNLDRTPKGMFEDTRLPGACATDDGKRKKVIHPTWYSELCPRASQYDEYPPGPSKISPKKRICPKLLRLTWNRYPLHYHDTYKWGYLIPSDHTPDVIQGENELFPTEVFKKYCEDNLDQPTQDDKTGLKENNIFTLERTLHELGNKLQETLDDKSYIELSRQMQRTESELKKMKKQKAKSSYHPQGAVDIGLCGALFVRLPHKDGPENDVGTPLAKNFFPFIENGTLSSDEAAELKKVFAATQEMSYWTMSKKRIIAQMALKLPLESLPDTILQAADLATDEERDSFFVGAIIPQLVTAGTVTRRAVEPTWLTASNSYPDRLGSELKAMIQTPPGYKFVGADVDSQELWIAAVFGDAAFAGVHGCTAFGWMNLQGNKKDGTDLHSQTARLAGITRDHAKIINYGRIYGGGQAFAIQQLRQFNAKMTHEEAYEKTKNMYEATKGKKIRNYKAHDEENAMPENYGKWEGGTESAVFNKLEEIAFDKQPRTPALGCRISKALEPHNVSTDFLTSRVNWAVQSSGVDYLHLLLVCMRWLCDKYDIDARFSISIHDEVRYLVTEKDSYRLALALQISNLYTRALFSYQLGMNDLPLSVAFFSAVDIDTCLRKEVYMDCVTPSNKEGLEKNYGIPQGVALDIHEVLEKTGGSLAKPDTNRDTEQSPAEQVV